MSAASTPALPFDPATVQFDPLLRRLNLANTRRHWQRLFDRAETHGWSCREFLGVLVTEEIAHRQQTRIQRSVRQARFPFLKTVEEFDSLLPVQCAPAVAGQLFGTRAGQRGTQPHSARQERSGKIAPGHRHRLPRHPERLHRSLRHRRRADRESVRGQPARQDCRSNSLTTCSRTFWSSTRWATYPTGPDAANVLFHIVNERHQRGRPMLFTTNKPPLTAWGEVLHDHDLAEAIVDPRARKRSPAPARRPIISHPAS